jgi:hypothetical protein
MMLEVCWGGFLDTLLLGSHNFMVAALGPCVKWPSKPVRERKGKGKGKAWNGMT